MAVVACMVSCYTQSPRLYLLAETDVHLICDGIEAMQPPPALVVIDSIQTMQSPELSSAPGSITQVCTTLYCTVQHCMQHICFFNSVYTSGVVE
jgi:predicted ATP-dependent serine protease